MATITCTISINLDEVIAAMRRFEVALEDIDIRPFLSFVKKDNTSPDWYDLWTRDLL